MYFPRSPIIPSEIRQDDGSLSIYYGRRKKAYANVGAEHGKTEDQAEMVEALIKNIRRR